jgi:hypothetical protein
MAESSLSPEQLEVANVPEDIAAAGWLTPWAAEFRYDDEPLQSLDRDIAVELAGSAVTWCEGLLAEAQTDEAGEDQP